MAINPSEPTQEDDKSEPRFLGNSSYSTLTLAPFGAVLSPPDDPELRSMHLREDAEDGDWLCVHRSGYPVMLGDRETELSTWSFSDTSEPAKIAGTWFHDTGVRQGLRAQALKCDVMLTNRAVRIGMSVGAYPKKGPWVLSDEKSRMVELKSDRVFAAVIPYEDIDEIDGGKNYLEIKTGIAAMSLIGKIGRDTPEGNRGKPGPMPEFSTAVTQAVIASLRGGSDPAKRAVAERVAATDYRSSLSKRFGSKLNFER